MKKGIFFIGLLLVAVLVFLFLQSRGGSAVKLQNSNGIEDFELVSFDGQTIKLSDYRGRPVFIDFWAAWCPFCLTEMPEIEKIFLEFGDPSEKELVVLGIHRTSTETLETGKSFARKIGTSYPLLIDAKDEVYKAYLPSGSFMPFAVYINRDGEVHEIKAGPKTAEEMRIKIRGLLSQ